jgi:hypothetical protein
MRRKLYKYQSINKFTISALKQKGLWASSPSSFNDPFEFRLKDISIGNDNDLKGIEEIRKMNLRFSDYSDFELAEIAKVELQQKMNEFGVICFSESNDNMLMWSHYSDNHFGICLGFEFEDTNETGVYKVKYEKSYPVLDFQNIWHIEGMAKIILTKSIDWAYESEWRLISTSCNEIKKYPVKLTEVIFGCRISTENEKQIMEILNDDGLNYYYAELDDEKYQIKISE